MKLDIDHLTDIIAREELQSLVQTFSEAFHFGAYIVDAKGERLVNRTCSEGACAENIANPRKKNRCRNDTLHRINDDAAVVKKCWAGFYKIVLPVRFKGRVIAWWITCGIPADFDRQMLDAVIGTIDSFINNLTLKTYERWGSERDLLVNVINGIVSSQDYESILERIGSAASSLLGTDRTTIFSFEGDRLVSKIAEGLDRQIEMAIGEGAAGRCAKIRSVIIENRVSGDTDIKVIVPEYQISNLICAPIIFKRTLLGVIESFNKAGDFTNRDKKLLSYLADTAAIALNNARNVVELRRLSITDPLTGLYNRKYFETSLGNELRRLHRYSGCVSLIFIDIDDFKKINDTHGHTVGDFILKELSKHLARNLREVDIAARYGGEEFIIMLPNTASDGARMIGERLLASIHATAMAGQHITVSMGVSSHEPGMTVKKLIDRADLAMYRIKKSGKAGVKTWDDIVAEGRPA